MQKRGSWHVMLPSGVVYPSCTHGYLPMGIPKNMGIYPYPNTHESTVWVDTHTQIPNGIHGLGICVLGLNLPLFEQA